MDVLMGHIYVGPVKLTRKIVPIVKKMSAHIKAKEMIYVVR